MTEPSNEVAVAADGAMTVRSASLTPPVPAQSVSNPNLAKLQSEKVVVAAPLSFAGSAARIWKFVGLSDDTLVRVALGAAAIVMIAFAWTLVLGWYLTFGLLVVPYRLIRRGQRKDKRQALQHREMMAAIQSKSS